MSPSPSLSLIVCSRNGAAKLPGLLDSLRAEAFSAVRAEAILVDNASNDDSGALMRRFADVAGFPVRVVEAPVPGLSRARNIGAAAARGGLLAFTDDDCRLHADYLAALSRGFDGRVRHYGGGAIVLGDPTDDPRMANTAFWTITRPTGIEPRRMMRPGLIQGANIFLTRSTFEAVGGFDEDLGPGVDIYGEDVEIVGRASALGYHGVLLPDAIVYHFPGRKPGEAATERVVESYDVGRGVYYASLAVHGEFRGWDYWRRSLEGQPLSPRRLARLQRELEGAAAYAALRRRKPLRPGRPAPD